MPLLAIDTSANYCSVAVVECDSGKTLAEISKNIGRGHAELLMSEIEACLNTAGVSYNNLSMLAVTIGPGSFTGVRVGMAAARGLRLGLSIPLVGVSTLDAAERHARELGASGPFAVLLDAKRDQAFCKLPGIEPSALSYDELVDALEDFNGTLCGSGAGEYNLRSNRDLPIAHELNAIPINVIARQALGQTPSDNPPEPLYLRSADAKKQAGFALPRVGA